MHICIVAVTCASVPTVHGGMSLRLFKSALKEAMKLRTCAGASDLFQKMDNLKTRVVVDEQKQVLISRVLCAHKGTGYVGVDETPGVGRFLMYQGVSMPRRIHRLGASRTTINMIVGERGRGVDGNGG
eukprot:5991912-Pleurochrysis_carterae.AAC.3